MPISDLDIETRDLDWFASDKDGMIGHFATGGHGAVPQVIARSCSIEDLNQVANYFRKQPALACPIVNEGLASYVALKDERAKGRYLEDFL